MRDLSDIVLRPSEFAVFRELMRADRDFPVDHWGWELLVARAAQDARERNIYPEPLLLDVGEFDAWCQRLQIVPCLDALRAFVIVKRRLVLPEVGSVE